MDRGEKLLKGQVLENVLLIFIGKMGGKVLVSVKSKSRRRTRTRVLVSDKTKNPKSFSCPGLVSLSLTKHETRTRVLVSDKTKSFSLRTLRKCRADQNRD